MLPGDGTLTDPSLPADFLWKMRSVSDPLTDYERGGAALNQTGGALDVQTWTFGYTAPHMWVMDEAGAKTNLLDKAGVTELGGSFDQNMNPFLCWVDGSGAHYWWFDTSQNKQVISGLPSNATNPRCCIDDHRSVFLTTSDIILAYQKNGDVYTRQQRDRYGIEYQKSGGTTGIATPCGGLMGLGMNLVNRLQFAFGGS